MAESARMETISKAAEKLRDQLVATRRDIYMHPELTGQEERTAALVAERLRALGLEVRTGVGGHGVVGVLNGGKAGSVVAMRADMDACAMEDTLDAPYRSRVPGVKHVCGHDVHTTIGLGVAEVLSGLRPSLPGRVKFLFQPAEEGGGGARAMIGAGALLRPRPEGIFAFHVTSVPVGYIAYVPGLGTVGGEQFTVMLRPKDHGTPVSRVGALAEECVPVLESLNILTPPELSPEHYVTAYEVLRSTYVWIGMRGPFSEEEYQALRRYRPEDPSVSDEVGTVRLQVTLVKTVADDLRDRAEAAVRKCLDSVLSGSGATYEIKHVKSSPALVNDEDLVRESRAALVAAVGEERAVEFRRAALSSGDDFSEFLLEVPGAMFWLGAANRRRGIDARVHTPDFDVDEECLVVGTKAMASVLTSFLDARANLA